MKELYFDNQLLAHPSKATMRKMEEVFNQMWTSSSAPYCQEREGNLKDAYEALYTLAGAHLDDHLIITSSGAEAINHAIFSTYLNISRRSGKNHFITSNIDEAPSILAMTRLQELGCVFHMAPANQYGIVTPKAIIESLTPRTAMLSLSWANGLTGVIQPVLEIAEICKERGILFHVDATHVMGKGAFSFQESGADFLSFNGEQIHAPKGIGALFVKNGIEISPLILGGNEQGGMRGGSFNEVNLIGFGNAAQEAYEMKDHLCMETARLRDQLEKGLSKNIPNLKLLFQEAERIPNVTAMGFPFVTSDALLFLLSRKRVFANMGGSHFQQIAHILKACDVPDSLCHSALSFSLSRDTTEEEVSKGVEIISETVLQLQKYSKRLFQENGK